VLCSLMFFLGLVSKEEMISLPIVLFLYELLTFRNFKYYLKTLISFLPPIAFYGLLRFWVLGTLFWEKRFLGGFQFLLQQMGFFWTNFWLSLSEPVVFHDLRVFPWVIIYPFLLISFAIGVYCLWQRKPLGFIFLYPYILILSFAPVLNKHFLGMEYRLFLSNSFFILLLFLSLQKFALDIRLQRFLLLIIILGASLVSIYRACIYANTLSLWENTVTRYPNVSWARVNYGKELEERGLYQKAIEEWEQALRMNPQDFLAHYNLGVALGTVGKFTEALDEFKKAAKLTPSFAPAHYNLGLTYLILGDKIKAQEEFDKARELGWEVKVPEIKDGKN
ncbi:MAG TPA: tetratricopeptide repeat protein, partial [Candidatus Omnitrophica bacterium]|nr:tetratricopeptide repeat protein [Candidatus Omnitrophota bacterium]